MYIATRASRDAVAFGLPARLTELAAADGDDFHYYLSDRTREIFFASTRSWGPAGGRAMWRAEICRDGPCRSREVTCPEGRLSEDRLHCYWRLSAPVTWGNGVSSCGTGGHMATIQSAAENAMAAFLAPSGQTWLGGYDGMPGIAGLPAVPQCTTATPGCGFAWTTGEPWTYAIWSPGEPNNNLGGSPLEDGLLFRTSGWNDGATSSPLPVLCERETWPTW